MGTCDDIWGDYAGAGPECDEYPLPSTYEGASLGDRRYSARLIEAADNKAEAPRSRRCTP
ncbi:hypothetical protein [Kitasatospora cinereorecta]|uniref:hypothetical protein n=1 Tax=Kitasatospora cinereorecta TaxID=285560 RepID=UPI003D15F21F